MTNLSILSQSQDYLPDWSSKPKRR